MACAGHSHDHDHDDPGQSLHQYIDLTKVFCLNEHHPNMGRDVLKPHGDRLSNTNTTLKSNEDDSELLLYIPFTEAVTVQSISVQGGSSAEEDSAPPKVLKIFCDREDLDFDTARDLDPSMALDLLPPEHFPDGTIDYMLRPAGRFQSIASITLYFGENWAGEDVSTEISYIGFKGRGMNVKRKAVDCVYESIGQKKDHKVPGAEMGSKHFLS